jgi:phosphocarrier protein HPr
MALDDILTQREVKVVNPLGLHARPAGQFVKLANTFASNIEMGTDAMMVNGKSILGVMMVAAECGSTIRIKASGEDAEKAVAALVALVERGFGEG